MNSLKKVLKFLSITAGLILGIAVFSFIIGTILKKSYNEVEVEAMSSIFFSSINAAKPSFINHIYKADFFAYMLIRIVTIISIIVLINVKNKPHRTIKYLGTSLVLSSCIIILFGAFYQSIIALLDSKFVNIMTGSSVFRPNTIIFGSLFLLLGLFLHVIYSTIDVIHDEKHNRSIINDNK